ncbi:MAG: FliA/WhiG family RNA polymerase sigma factor [Pseudomonadota bacterium]
MMMQKVSRETFYANSACKMCEKDRESLIIQYAPFVKYIAGKMAMKVPPNISLDELISAGTLGLVDAVNKFDPGRDIQFKTYAEFRIKGAILDELRGMDQFSRSIRKKIHSIEDAISATDAKLGRPAEDSEIAREMGVGLEEYYELLADVQGYSILSLDEFIKTGSNNTESQESYKNQIKGNKTPAHHVDRMELRKVIANALKTLTSKEQMVISLYYYDELTLKEIGSVMDLTESRISQIHTKAIIKLKIRLKSYYEHR